MTDVHARYEYTHDDLLETSQAIDVHHIVVRKSSARSFLKYISIFFLVANLSYFLAMKENSLAMSLWTVLLGVFFVKSLCRKAVVKESVVVMPAFGVQFEAHYKSGKVDRCFVPIGKILKPVMNECVTPITCYWSLALIVRGEEELMLVFKEVRPPVKMLVPIWKALNAAIDGTENRCTR